MSPFSWTAIGDTEVITPQQRVHLRVRFELAHLSFSPARSVPRATDSNADARRGKHSSPDHEQARHPLHPFLIACSSSAAACPSRLPCLFARTVMAAMKRTARTRANVRARRPCPCLLSVLGHTVGKTRSSSSSSDDCGRRGSSSSPHPRWYSCGARLSSGLRHSHACSPDASEVCREWQ